MLVGREREQGVIAELLSGARDGRSGVLALVGEVGIGKSTLLEWAAAQAGDMAILRARGVQSEAHIPFAGLFDLLRPALDSLDELPRPQAAALEGALALRPGGTRDRLAVGAATLSLLAAHAERRPVTVLVDDAQWLDGSTADALRFALRRLLADPIAVLLTVRSGLPSLVDDADLPVLVLEGLDAAATAELLAARAPTVDAGAAVRLHQETGGNPLALVELVRDAGAAAPLGAPVPVPAPASLTAAYVARADALPEAAQRMLLLAAASDRGEADVLARAAAGMGSALEDIAPAEAAGLVLLEGGRLRFSHPLVRSAVYGAATPDRRREVHHALAGALPDADDDRRAWHMALAATGVDAAASSALEGAAERAHRRSAHAVASHAYERAAGLSPDASRRGRLLLSAAESAWLAGGTDRALALLDEVPPDGASDGLRPRLDSLRGHIRLYCGPVDQARSLLFEAAERAAPSSPTQAVVMLGEATAAAFYAANPQAAQACAEFARRLARDTDELLARFFADLISGMADVFAGNGEQGMELIRRAVQLMDDSGQLPDDPRLLSWAAMGPLWLREVGAGEHLIERALATARATGAVGVLPTILLHVGIDEAAGDRWAQARATFDEAIRLGREMGVRTPLAGSLARLALVEARAGSEAAARAHAEEALEIAGDLGTHLYTIWALMALGDLELGRGDLGAALETFHRFEQTLREHGIADADLSPAPELVELHLRAGDRERAEQAAAPFITLAEVKGQPWARARAARCTALLGGDDELDAAFGTALELHARTHDVFETARTQLAYGSRLRRAGRRQQAREQLRAALATFERLGAEPWVDQADHELRATGETARRRDASTLDDLTPQELRVAVLLAGGRTTREAAAELFLSPKTVEYHLRNAYRKLGVRSREELAEALEGRREPESA
ncbi:MAG TPA: AAA family ATPase [Gaiellales bacterium]|jgi:DNA-binding CsgD family transcriptional regulator|nr:AAA family ATPase [Gaiellales bacterium]